VPLLNGLLQGTLVARFWSKRSGQLTVKMDRYMRIASFSSTCGQGEGCITAAARAGGHPADYPAIAGHRSQAILCEPGLAHPAAGAARSGGS
jgi:hypothetical protein